MKILPEPLEFEWDKGNQDKNFRKHKVTNKESEEAFENAEKFLHKDEKHSTLEQRYMLWVAIGQKMQCFSDFITHYVYIIMFFFFYVLCSLVSFKRKIILDREAVKLHIVNVINTKHIILFPWNMEIVGNGTPEACKNEFLLKHGVIIASLQ